MFDDIVIDLWSSCNFVSMNDIIRTYNPRARFTKSKHSVRAWRKTSVLRHANEARHVKKNSRQQKKKRLSHKKTLHARTYACTEPPSQPPSSSEKTSFTPNLHHRHTDRRFTPFLCFLSSFTPNLHHRHTDRWSRTISKKKSSSKLRNKPKPPWATIQRFVFHNFPFSPIWISNWVFGFFVCFIGKFQILSISFLMRTEGECLFVLNF